MITTCWDCEQTKRGCKRIVRMLPPWDVPPSDPKDDLIGKPICRTCANFAKKCGEFYEVA